MLGISESGKAARKSGSDVLASRTPTSRRKISSGTNGDPVCILSVVLLDGHHRILFSHALFLA